MPLFEYECMDCQHRFESLERNPDKPEAYCPRCGFHQLQRLLTSHAGYSIKGDNSASVRPKGAGSFKGGSE